MTTYTHVARAGNYLRASAAMSLEEALLDLRIASSKHPEKVNEFSKLRVKVARVQRRLRVLADAANDLALKSA